ncbi:MAG: YfhO family protein [Bacteroidota bacterium]
MAKKNKQQRASSGMNLSDTQRNLIQHASIILVFFLVVYAFFNPLFNNQQLDWHDIKHYKGMAKESADFREATGEEALWVSTLFSGMPAYQTSITYPGNWFWDIDKLFYFGLPRPANYVFLTFLGFFFLLRTLKVDPWLSGIGAAAFALSSYHFIILTAGHTSKANAIAYWAPTLAGALMAYRGKWLLGGGITAFFFALQVSANHYQMTYFLALMLVSLGIVYGVHAIREKQIPQFLKASAVLVMAGLLGVLPNLGKLMTTNEYAKETIRGKAELAAAKEKKDSGLSFDYAMEYSEGKFESFSLLIPNVQGGPSVSTAGKSPEARKNAVRLQDGRNVIFTYWGAQRSTAGPAYAGAIICFLFLLGLLLVQDKIRWWLLTITIIGLMLSWGINFEWLARLCFSILPGYDMFRAPTMYITIVEIALPILGILGLQQFLSSEIGKEQKQKALYIAAGVTAGLCALFALIGPSVFDFIGDAEESRNQLPSESLRSYRASLLQSDAFRSAGFILAAAGALWLYLQDKIKDAGVYVGIGLLVVMDLLVVNSRYFTKDKYISTRRFNAVYEPSPADKFILQDADPNYRVFNMTSSDGPFNDAITSYHHKSIGGYHAAKLRRYNDLISQHIGIEQQMFIQTLRANQQQLTDSLIQSAVAQMRAVNMLNTRYIIINPQGQPIQNRSAMGNAWMVRNIQRVNSPDEEISALRGTDLRTTAIVDHSIFEGAFAKQLEGFNYQADPGARISLSAFTPKHLTYDFNANSEQVVVFSEIYYNDKKGWNAYIDGELVPHFRANYVLRGLRIPAGSHTVEFKFEPQSYHTGNSIALLGSILCLLFFLGALGWDNRTWIQERLGKSSGEE